MAMAAPPVLAGIITLVLLKISPPSENPTNTGLRGIFGPPRVFPRFGVPFPLNWYSLNFANPWAWVYLVVIALLMVAPLFIASAAISHLLANLTN